MLEENAVFFSALAGVMGTLMALAYLPQLYRIIKRKSSADLSLPMLVILALGSVSWLLYGLSINNMTIVVPNSIGVVAVSSVIVAYFKFRK